MEQCVEGAPLQSVGTPMEETRGWGLMRRYVRDLLVRAGRKYLLLSDHGMGLQVAHDRLRERCTLLELQQEQLKGKNAALECQNITLAAMNREKDNLISIVAHDLRAPLSRCEGLCRLLQSDLLAEEQEKVVDLMIRVNHDGLQLVNDILDLSSGVQQEATPVKLNLHHFITDHLEKFFIGLAGQKGIRIHTAILEDLDIVTDEHSLRRIIDNLVSNAVKFSFPGTDIFIRGLREDDAVLISVQDQGPGISEEDQQKMFRRFQKLTARPTSGETSTGLGLAIVKKLVAKLQGTIAVYSEVGAGTEFVVRLGRGVKVVRC